jgi:uncharacterized protein
MPMQIFVNLPVKDLNRAIDFFTKLGFTFNQQFTDENATCMVITNDIYAMLLVEEFFQTFTTKEVADASRTTEAIVALGVDSRAQVDELADTALASGGQPVKEPMREGSMYGRSFQDPDGHIWEVFYLDPAAVQG